jgi:La-related protein 7
LSAALSAAISKREIMAVEKKRKAESMGSGVEPNNEGEQALAAKKSKVAQSHKMAEAKEPEHMDLARNEALVHGKGRKRHRKKRLYNEICQQMEFYFGDANMSKSTFMNEAISKSEGGWLNLDIFLRFNKLVEMLKNYFGAIDIEDLWNALSFRLNQEKEVKDETKASNLLEIRKTDDGIKQIRRNKPLTSKATEEVERCTIYIENLPPFVTNDSLKKMFSEKHGAVDYVSLPRYKHNRAVKGFAFIEFADIEGADAAIKMFDGDNPPKEISENQSAVENQRIRPIDKDPAELQSIKSFQVEQAIEQGVTIPVNTNTADKPEKDPNDEGTNIGNTVKQDLDNIDKSKEEKVDNVDKDQKNIDTVDSNNTLQETALVKDGSDTVVTNPQTVKIEGDENKETSTAKKRKKRQKNKNIQLNMHPNQGTYINAPDGSIMNSLIPLNGGNSDDYVLSVLRIMTKEEWRKMRNKYLNLQKQNMSAVKSRIRQIQPITKEKIKEPPQAAVHSHQTQAPCVDTPLTSGSNNKGTLELVPGTIVRFTLDESVIDQGKQIKSRLRAAVMEPVKYVDVTNGSINVFVRCTNQKQAEVIASAKNLVSSSNGEILTGKEETEYWDKIHSDREDKISGKIKVKPVSKKERGKDRVVRKYDQSVRNSHKFFEEVGDE